MVLDHHMARTQMFSVAWLSSTLFYCLISWMKRWTDFVSLIYLRKWDVRTTFSYQSLFCSHKGFAIVEVLLAPPPFSHTHTPELQEVQKWIENPSVYYLVFYTFRSLWPLLKLISNRGVKSEMTGLQPITGHFQGPNRLQSTVIHVFGGCQRENPSSCNSTKRWSWIQTSH